MKKKIFLVIFLIAVSFLITSCNKEQIRCKDCNVILITIDALRPDHMGSYGYDRPTTPNIDKLAEDSIIFTTALTVVSHTFESLASMLTSTYPHTHEAYEGNPLSEGFITLPEVLKENGYHTAAIIAPPHINSTNSNFDQGFDIYQDIDESRIQQKWTSKMSKNEEFLLAYTIAEDTNKILENMSKHKFFVWLHFWDVHFPYKPPPEYAIPFLNKYVDTNKATDPENPSMKNPVNPFDLNAEWVKDFIYGGERVTDLNAFITLYDAQIPYVDNRIGVILSKLEELNLDEKTIIIISADHGHSLGEHRYFFNHRDFVYDPELKIPLIIKIPGISKRMIDYQVQNIDFFPTILSILGIKSDIKFEGNVMFKENTGYAFSENMDCTCVPECYPPGQKGKLKAIRTEEWKLIRTPTKQGHIYELYNLKKDPKELNNVINENPKIAENLKRKLEDWTANEDYTQEKEMDESLKDTLKSLGYTI